MNFLQDADHMKAIPVSSFAVSDPDDAESDANIGSSSTFARDFLHFAASVAGLTTRNSEALNLSLRLCLKTIGVSDKVW